MDEKQTSNVNARNFQGKKKLNPAHNSRPKPNSGTHSFNKRPTGKPFQRVNDIYVSNKANFKVRKMRKKIIIHRGQVSLFNYSIFIFIDVLSRGQVQMKQCQELLMSDEVDEIYLHCLGNAINRGITLALTLVQESNNGLGYEANTSTIDLIGKFLFHFI